MCRSDIALKNMDAIGYVSAVATPEVLEAKIDDTLEEAVDASYFFGPGAESVKIDAVQYPDRAVIERCAMMHDSGARTEQMLEMWARVKGEVVKPWVLIVIGITLLAMLVLGIRRKIVQYRRSSAYRRRRRKK
jgi:spermidine/putrescine transport system substrate-binding protein